MAQVTYLEYSAGPEHKFYEVTLDGTELNIRYGRIGTDGQTQHKTFDSEAKAQAEAEKKLAEKRKKGYADAVKGQTEKRAVEKPRLPLPKALHPYRESIEGTLRPAVALSLQTGATGLWDSKVGGTPYRPQGTPWPHDQAGQPLAFLAQLNFSALPPLPGFPENGILQFFIGTDDLYGCDFDQHGRGVQDTFRVLFYEQVTQNAAELDTTTPEYPDEDDHYSPFDAPLEYRLTGERFEQPMTFGDDRFRETVGVDFFDEEQWPGSNGEELYEQYEEIARHGRTEQGGHQLGGYPSFTQADPRSAGDGYELLFQLDSDMPYGICWGDLGIANFFIRPADLAKRDFSRVWYNWDCG